MALIAILPRLREVHAVASQCVFISEAEGLVFRSVSFSRFVCPDIQGDL